MILKELLTVIEPIEVLGNVNKEVKGLHFDSRKIGEGDLFVAQVGTAVDGHQFVSEQQFPILSEQDIMSNNQLNNPQQTFNIKPNQEKYIDLNNEDTIRLSILLPGGVPGQ